MAATVQKVSKYGFISAPYFPVFRLKTGKYEPQTTPYLDTSHAENNKANMLNAKCEVSRMFYLTGSRRSKHVVIPTLLLMFAFRF